MKHRAASPRNPLRRFLLLFAGSALALAAPVLAGLSAVRSARFFSSTFAEFSPGASDEYGTTLAVGDFNCDGRDDLAVGAPLDDPDGIVDAGSVQIRYGLIGIGVDPGFTPVFLSQIGGTSPDEAEAGDQFGGALAAGDWNGDGCDDLAVGVPGENSGGINLSGAVQIHMGGFSGILENSFVLFHQNSTAVFGGYGAGNRFGAALAAGDFNGDGDADLAIGTPYGETPGAGASDFGVVQIVYGSGAGLTTVNAELFAQGLAADGGTRGTPETDDRFGFALAAGRFNADDFDDLAIGVPGESVPEEVAGTPIENAGLVQVLYGSSAANGGLRAIGDQLFDQDTGTLADQAEAGDEFGLSLAVGDFNDFGGDDLAIGVPFEGVGAAGAAGVVHILLSQDSGLSTANAFYWDQNGTHVDTSEASDLWGWAIAAADFNADGRDDLAAGSWNENVTGQAGQGVVIVLDGPPGPLAFGERWHQDVPGVPDEAENLDQLGASVAVGDFDGDGHADLVVGVPKETGSLFRQGAISVFYGSLYADGFESGDPCLWSETSPGDPGC